VWRLESVQLKHDFEKWIPVFEKDLTPTITPAMPSPARHTSRRGCDVGGGQRSAVSLSDRSDEVSE